MSEVIPTEPFRLDIPKEGGCSILLAGSTRSGKSTALGHILHKYFSKYISVLMTHSPQADIYKDIDCLQAPNYYPAVIRDMAYINKKTENKYDFLAILDDVVTGIKHDKEILKMLTIYRNSNCSTIMCIQALTLMNSAGRTNVNFVVLFKFNSDAEIERAVKMYLGSYFPKDMKLLEKMRLYREMTENHYCFIVDNLNGRVFRSKIPVGE